jgi:hypothetical protein
MASAMVRPYIKAEAQAQARAKSHKSRQERLKGVTKWVNGQPTLSYARVGWQWVNGKHIKVDKRASGVTQQFSMNRHDERAERATERRKHGYRARQKARAREQYERVKPINAKRLAALKADQRAERMAREVRYGRA